MLITSDSKPDYDDWGPDTYWSCSDWITWFYALKKEYGSTVAIQKWEEAWGNQSIDEHDYSWCKYDSDFNAFLKKEGIKGASHLLANTIIAATDVIDNVGTAAQKASKTVSTIIPIVIIIAVLLAAFFVYKNFIVKTI